MRRGEVHHVNQVNAKDEAQAICDHVYTSDRAVAFTDIRCPWATVWSDKVSLIEGEAQAHARDNGHNVTVTRRTTITYGSGAQ
jgi:hypothetical protein